MAENSHTELARQGEEFVSQSFVYLVSARGANNFWARLLNGCDKVVDPTTKTMSVGISENGRFVLFYNPEFIATIAPRMLKLVLVHEAGHIALRHHERFFRILAQVKSDPKLKAAITAVFNLAADYADNDAVVRHEEEFAPAVKAGEWIGLLPETAEPPLPQNLSFEDYVLRLVPEAESAQKMLEKLLEEAEKQAGEEGEDGEGGKGGDEGQESDGQAGDSGQTKTGKGKGSGKSTQKGPASFSDDPDDTVTDDMKELADNEGLVKKVQDAFNRLTKGSHDKWLEKVKEMTPEEALHTANKLKNHAKRLARSAWEQTIKARGFTPGHIQGLIKPLLKDDQVPWHWFFSDAVQAQISSKIIEAMAAPNLTMINDGGVEPWPGYALDSEFQVVWVDDVSGSMSNTEYARACAIFNSMMTVDKRIKCRRIQVDAAIQCEADVDNITPGEQSQDHKRYGYGGTVYTPAFRRILGLDEPRDWFPDAPRCDDPVKKPDLVVVYTDGYVGIKDEVLPRYHPGCPIIWLVAPGCKPADGMENVPPDFVIQMHNIGEAED